MEALGYEFSLPTCGRFYNLFHPMDPFAYRLEPFIVSPCPPKPSQVPHHKGRKRLHLELADNLGKAAAEFRSGLMSTMKTVMSTVKRAAGYDEDQQQAEQLANEMIQVPLNVFASFLFIFIVCQSARRFRHLFLC